MELKDILAISGQPGLFKFIAQGTNGIIVESLADGRRSNTGASARVSALSEIAIYTDADEVPLATVFRKLYEKTGGKESIDKNADPQRMKAMFAELLPDYDRERVHVSDMKKAFSWYNILVGAGMTDFSIEKPEEEVAAPSEE